MNLATTLEFLIYKGKGKMLHSVSKLKNVASPEVGISEDFSSRTKLFRERLWEFALHYREQGTHYNIIRDKLHADIRTFAFNHATNSVALIRGGCATRVTNSWLSSCQPSLSLSSRFAVYYPSKMNLKVSGMLF